MQDIDDLSPAQKEVASRVMARAQRQITAALKDLIRAVRRVDDFGSDHTPVATYLGCCVCGEALDAVFGHEAVEEIHEFMVARAKSEMQ
jgi:hypothetical protein